MNISGQTYAEQKPKCKKLSAIYNAYKTLRMVFLNGKTVEVMKSVYWMSTVSNCQKSIPHLFFITL